MTLGEKQEVFLYNVALMVLWGRNNGYRLRGHELRRTKEQAAIYAELGIGLANSLHRDSLAIDLYGSKNGKWMRTVESYRELAEFWKGLHPLNRWGGDWEHPKTDAPHFSMSHGGRA